MTGMIEFCPEPQQPSLIYLTGFMASGKSTVGYALAQALQKDFFDLDQEIEIRLDKTISQIFQDEGPAFFREIEREVLIDLAKLKNAVIALGGGTLLEVENLMLVQQTGIAICLTATPAETWKRIEDTEKRKLIVGSKTAGRVLSTTNQIYRRIESLMLIRKPGYEQSEIIIDTTNKTIPQIVQEILMLLEPFPIVR
jgi:shikimate kinase